MKVERLLWHHSFRFIRTASDASAALCESYCSSHAVNYKQTTKTMNIFDPGSVFMSGGLRLIRLGNLDESRKKHHTIRSIPVWYLKHTSLSPGKLGLNTPPSEETLQPLWLCSCDSGHTDLVLTFHSLHGVQTLKLKLKVLLHTLLDYDQVDGGQWIRAIYIVSQASCSHEDGWPAYRHVRRIVDLCLRSNMPSFPSVKLTFWCLLFERKVFRETFFLKLFHHSKTHLVTFKGDRSPKFHSFTTYHLEVETLVISNPHNPSGAPQKRKM